MFGLDAKPMGNHFPVGIYAIPEMSMIGATEEELTRQGPVRNRGRQIQRDLTWADPRDEHGMFKMIFHRDTGRFSGVIASARPPS